MKTFTVYVIPSSEVSRPVFCSKECYWAALETDLFPVRKTLPLKAIEHIKCYCCDFYLDEVLDRQEVTR